MKKLISLLPLFTLLCGCYPYTEVENMDILTSLYADAGDSKLQLGGGVANVRSFADAMAENPVSLIRAEGADLEAAVTTLRQSADHELFYGALRAVIIGEGLAQKNIYPLVQYLDAQPRLRRSTAVFVTDSDLEAVIGYKAINDFSGGFAADSIISTLYTLGETHYTGVGDILYAHTYGDAGYCIPHITLQDDILRMDGYCLFNGGTAVGFTDNPAVSFFTVKNAAQQHIVNAVPLTTRLKSKTITPHIQNGHLHITANLSFSLEQNKGADTLQPARRRAAVQALQAKLQAQTEAALAQVRATECDFLELYKYRLAQSRTDFDIQAWNALLPHMTFDVTVTLK